MRWCVTARWPFCDGGVVETLTAHVVGRRIRAARIGQGLSQQALAERCGVSRKFIGELESGKEHASLGLALRVLDHLDIDLHAGDRSRDEGPGGLREDAREGSDVGEPGTRLEGQLEETLSTRDYAFALRLLGEYAGMSLSVGRAQLRHAPRIDDQDYLIMLAGISRWVSLKTATPTPAWALKAEASRHPIFPAEKLHPVSERMKDLIRRETPPALAGLNVWIRERDLGRV
jgi:transcriptional regulator with XRE-family HTH domain